MIDNVLCGGENIEDEVCDRLNAYLAKPRSERYVCGFWYKHYDICYLNRRHDFHIWAEENHPFQFFIRYSFYWFVRRKISLVREFFSDSYRWCFKPCHVEIRAAVPRLWMDLDSVMEEVNFAIICQFQKEANNSWLDYVNVDDQREFKQWMDSAVNWIRVERVALQKQIDDASESLPKRYRIDSPEFQGYCEISRTNEDLIREGDTKILKEMVEKRGYFWT